MRNPTPSKIAFIAVEALFILIIAVVSYKAVQAGEGPIVAVSATFTGALLGFIIGLVWRD